MSIFDKHAEQDKVAGEWLLRGTKLMGLTPFITGDPHAMSRVLDPHGAAKWRTLIYDISDSLPEHLAEFLRYRQEVGNVRYWCGPVAGKYATKGGYVPTRLTMNRMWKAIVNETVRLALEEGLL